MNLHLHVTTLTVLPGKASNINLSWNEQKVSSCMGNNNIQMHQDHHPFITLMYLQMAYSLKWYEVLFTKQSTNLEWALFSLLIYIHWSGFSNSSKTTVQYNVYKQQTCFKNVLSICLVAIHTLLCCYRTVWMSWIILDIWRLLIQNNTDNRDIL
jgi:hypothetical protein